MLFQTQNNLNLGSISYLIIKITQLLFYTLAYYRMMSKSFFKNKEVVNILLLFDVNSISIQKNHIKFQ